MLFDSFFFLEKNLFNAVLVLTDHLNKVAWGNQLLIIKSLQSLFEK
jgi:hypothetical protein